jgi:hypothetical protein
MNAFEQVTSMDILYRCWQKISAKNRASGLDGIDLSLYRADLQKNLRTLQASMACGGYRPYTEKVYANHKNRQICISCVDDKIVQTSLSFCLSNVYNPAKSTHGFIPNRSVFTAKKVLDNSLNEGVYEYSKVDIRHFYDSIDTKLLLHKVGLAIRDVRFLSLVELLLNAHRPGISTGSCLSPVLSNLYLAEFDREIESNSVFFARYVDDMLVAPVGNIELIGEKLAEVGLEINMEKSIAVNAEDGFRYLGFDIKREVERKIDSAIQNGNFALAEELYETQECDVAANAELPVVELPSTELVGQQTGQQAKPDYEPPNTIRNVVRKCHIVRSIVEKAETEKYLGFGEKSHLLQIFRCLGNDGAKFIHHVLSQCLDYDYAETQRRINRYDVHNPLGCKKLCERVGSDAGCTCNFTAEKVYPTPIIHALRVDRECFKPMEPKDSIGHFKAKNPKDKATDALGYLLELNKKQYELAQQQEIFRGQIEDLFARTNIRELQTPQGLLVKTDDGLFIKVG